MVPDSPQDDAIKADKKAGSTEPARKSSLKDDIAASEGERRFPPENPSTTSNADRRNWRKHQAPPDRPPNEDEQKEMARMQKLWAEEKKLWEEGRAKAFE